MPAARNRPLLYRPRRPFDATHAGNTPVGYRSATTALAVGYLKVRRS